MQNKKYYLSCGLLIGGGLLYYGLLPTFITTGIIAGMIALIGAIAFASKVNDLEINHNKL